MPADFGRSLGKADALCGTTILADPTLDRDLT